MLLKVCHHAREEGVVLHTLTIAHNTAVPPGTRHSHVHARLVGEKANLTSSKREKGPTGEQADGPMPMLVHTLKRSILLHCSS